MNELLEWVNKLCVSNYNLAKNVFADQKRDCYYAYFVCQTLP